MAGEIQITAVGNLTGDPELRFTPSGAAVANFTIAQTPRRFNRETNAWEDGDTIFLRCSLWRDYAENLANSLHRGDRVIAIGRLTQRTYEVAAEASTRTVMEMSVDEVGPVLRFVTVTLNRADRTPQTPQADPWATPQQGQSGQPGQVGQPGQQTQQPAQQPQPAQPQQQPWPGGWGGDPAGYGTPPF